MLKSAPHATIIGAGIIGVATAAFLQREGYAVTIIDRVPPGEGCSFGNAGGIAFGEIIPSIHPGMFTKIPGWLLDPLGPLTIRWRYLPKAFPWFVAAMRNASPKRVEAITKARADLGLRAVSDFEALLKPAGGHDMMVYRESLRLFDSEQQFKNETGERAIKAAHGFPVEIYSGDQAREMEPDIGPNITHATTAGGWYFVTNPERVVKILAKSVIECGGTILREDVQRVEIQSGEAKTLHLGSGRILHIDKLIICAGAFSNILAKQLGDRVSLEAERGYHITLPNSGLKLSRTLTYARTPGAATPMEMGLRLAGTDEFAGLDAAPNYKRADALWHIFKRALPGLNSPDENTTRWMGRRPGTPDSLPVVGRSATIKNVFYNFGHGHMGLTWGPTTGRIVSEIITGKPSNMDSSAFRANRF
jgi:D-amino-acid dehydrogenase